MEEELLKRLKKGLLHQRQKRDYCKDKRKVYSKDRRRITEKTEERFT